MQKTNFFLKPIFQSPTLRIICFMYMCHVCLCILKRGGQFWKTAAVCLVDIGTSNKYKDVKEFGKGNKNFGPCPLGLSVSGF